MLARKTPWLVTFIGVKQKNRLFVNRQRFHYFFALKQKIGKKIYFKLEQKATYLIFPWLIGKC